jgi:hypothetical protein
MIHVINHEIIPETHRHGFENEATLGLTIGLVAMTLRSGHPSDLSEPRTLANG